MEILSLLASSQDRRDEVPNVELAARVANDEDKNAVEELIGLLDHKNKNIRHDAIKVLYEVGALKPALIAGFVTRFKDLLSSKDNRMQWGAMTALQTIARVRPQEIYQILPSLTEAVDKGSVITRDQYVALLIQLMQHHPEGKDLFPLIIEQLQTCPDNQLPMYAEQALAVVPEADKAAFRKVLELRVKGIEKVSKAQRIEKVLKKLGR